MRIFNRLTKRLYSVKPLEEEVRERVAKEYGIDKNQLPKVEHRPLPLIGTITKYGRVLIGKIVGAYDRLKHKIYIDPRNYSSLDLYGKAKLLAEEFCHAADNLLGKLKNKYKSLQEYLSNYHKDEDEIRAKQKAEKIAMDIVKNRGNYQALYRF